jgi:hypothetical protein
MPNMLQVRAGLENKIGQLEVLVRDVRKLLNEMSEVLGAELGEHHPETHPLQPKAFAGMPMKIAIREYLQNKGGPATQDEILRGLQAGGANLKKVPRRTVANGVSFGVKGGYFERKGELVYLSTT